jgi:hypothetical protein
MTGSLSKGSRRREPLDSRVFGNEDDSVHITSWLSTHPHIVATGGLACERQMNSSFV